MSGGTRDLSVVALCGLAFSGKSTVARTVAAVRGFELIVLDAINEERGLDGGAGLTVAQWEETSSIAMQRLRSVLGRGRSAVVDDTHSHRFLRDRYQAVADEFGAAFSILFVDTPLAVIESRRAANDAHPIRPRIADAVFAAHRAAFQTPSSDEKVVRLRNDADLQGWLNP